MAMIDTAFRAALAGSAGYVIFMAFRYVWRNHITNRSRAYALHTIGFMLIPTFIFWAMLAVFGRFPADIWLSRTKDFFIVAGCYGLMGLIRQEEDL